MTQSFDADTTARHLFDAHNTRAEYCDLPRGIVPTTMGQAYAAQDAFAKLLQTRDGDIAGFKIATTTKVMQQLLGINHPCGGMIFSRRVHTSPAIIKLADYVNAGVECELAVRIGRDLAKPSAPFTAQTIRAAVTEVMPAFELIEDRKADYKKTNAFSLIAENCWNAGVVLGPAVPLNHVPTLTDIDGQLKINGVPTHEGATEDPLQALAWVANLMLERGYLLRAGTVVITGSVIPTLISLRAGDRLAFELKTLATVELRAA
jgi:2-keto-4-pentenoate hydratase